MATNEKVVDTKILKLKWKWVDYNIYAMQKIKRDGHHLWQDRKKHTVSDVCIIIYVPS